VRLALVATACGLGAGVAGCASLVGYESLVFTTDAAGDAVSDINSSDVDSSSDTPALTCTERYGATNGFQLCTETATFCSFVAIKKGSSCTDLCARFGGTCLSAKVNSSNCLAGSPSSCDDTTNYDDICTCTR
jgi:hypothetical protein